MRAPNAASERTIPPLYWAVAFLPTLLLFLRHWSFPPPYTSTDYAQYIMQARRILEGRFFAETEYIFTTLSPSHGPPAYPPGLPLTLAPIIGVFGHAPAVMKLVMLAMLVIFLVLAGRYFAARDGKWMAVSVVLLSGVALEASMATQVPMSDLGFAAISWAIVVLADSERRWSWAKVALITVLGLAAIAYRAAGVVLVPATLLFALLHIRRHGVRAFVPGVAWVAVLAMASVALQTNIADAFGGTRALARIVKTIWGYQHAVFSGVTYPFPWNGLNDVYHLFAVVLIAVGALAWLWQRERRRSLLTLYAFGTMAMLLLVWAAADRYLWPLFPLFVYWMLDALRLGLRTIVRSWSFERRSRIAFVCAAVIGALATATALAVTRPTTFMDHPDVRDIVARVRELGRTERDPRVLFVNPRPLALETGVPSMGFFEATPERTIQELRDKRLTHVIGGDMGISASDAEHIRRAIDAYPTLFDPVYRNSTFTLYRFGTQ